MGRMECSEGGKWDNFNSIINKYILKKPMVHLHNGILCSRKKEGAPTHWDSMYRTGEHYA